MQQKRTKTAKKGQKKRLKIAETDTNSVFMGVRAESARLQEIVTSPKNVEYGICMYQFFKFLA